VFGAHVGSYFPEIRPTIELDDLSLVLVPFRRWNTGSPVGGRAVDEKEIPTCCRHRLWRDCEWMSQEDGSLEWLETSSSPRGR
jgi:hypothetical protein